MAKIRSENKSQQDENALRQLEKSSNLRFWNRELRVRKACTDVIPENFMVAREALLFTIYYRCQNIKEPLDTFLDEALKQQYFIRKYQRPTKYSEILYYMEKNIEQYKNIIVAIIDSTLNLDESTFMYNLNFYVEHDHFYIDNIKKYLLTIRDTCLAYGLYPHQFERLNTNDLIHSVYYFGEEILNENEILFVVKPNPKPPVIFNHIVNGKNLFEKEINSNFYYYFNIEEYANYDVILECVKNKLTYYLQGDMNSRSNYDECTNRNIQISIDISNKDYNFKKSINHIKKELGKCFSYYYNPIQPLSHLEQIAANNKLIITSNLNVNEKKDIFKMLQTQIVAERQAVEALNITSGGYCSKINNITRLCGMYIWDLEHYYKIPHKFTVAFLAEDTKLKDQAEEALFTLTLNDYDDPRDNIEDIQIILADLGCTMTQKMLHQNYSNFCVLVENCTKHPLW